MSRYAVCLTTVSNQKEAGRIAKYLVDKKLAACVNIVPGITSYYRWKSKVCRDGEVLLIIKTVSSKMKLLGNALKHIHPYELPEFLALPVGSGSQPYLKWISSEV